MSKHNNLHHPTTQHGAGTCWIYSGYEKYPHALKISTISYREACCQDKKKTLFSRYQSTHRVAHKQGALQMCFGFFTCLFLLLVSHGAKLQQCLWVWNFLHYHAQFWSSSRVPVDPNFFHMIMEVTELLETRNEDVSFPSLVQMGQDCLWAHEEVLWTSFFPLICTTSWYLDRCVPWKSGQKQKKRGLLSNMSVTAERWILVDSSFSFLVICEELLKSGFGMLSWGGCRFMRGKKYI